MRLYFLNQTPLNDVDKLAVPPRDGDILVYLRDAQIVGAEELTYPIIDGEGLLNEDESNLIDQKSGAIIDNWYIDNGQDISKTDGISLGWYYSMEICRRANPRMLLRTAEILRRALVQVGSVDGIVSDIENGVDLERTDAECYDLRGILAVVVKAKGVVITFVPPVRALPCFIEYVSQMSARWMLRAYIGGFRPQFMKNKARNVMSGRRRIYTFLFADMKPLLDELTLCDDIEVVTNSHLYAAPVMRFDHFFPWPRLKLALALIRLKRDREGTRQRLAANEMAILSGVDYTDFFADLFLHVLNRVWFLGMIIQLQALRFAKKLRPDVVVINGQGDYATRTIIESAAHMGCRVVYMRHALTTLRRYGIKAVDLHHENVTYCAPGKGHLAEYDSPDGHRVDVKITGTPMSMPAIQRRVRSGNARRVLLVNYVPGSFFRMSARSRLTDAFYVQAFEAAKILHGDSWQFIYRHHPGTPGDVERRIAQDMGLADIIDWQPPTRDNDFAAALRNCDVVIANASTTYYKSLMAGLPTIYFEPGFRVDRVVGAPAALNLNPPIAKDTSELVSMLKTLDDPQSALNKFPAIFNGPAREQFVGFSNQKSVQNLVKVLRGTEDI